MSNGRCQRHWIVLSLTPPFSPLPARVQTSMTPLKMADQAAALPRRGECGLAAARRLRLHRRALLVRSRAAETAAAPHPGYRRRSSPGYQRRRRRYRRRRRSSRRGRCRGPSTAVEFVARWRRRLRHRGRQHRRHRFHAVPVRTKLPKEPPESEAPAPLSSRTNGLHITLLIFCTYYVHYCSYAKYVN
jgi:hypothetical protein